MSEENLFEKIETEKYIPGGNTVCGSYLSEEQFENLLAYKHFAPKTTFEMFMLNKVTCHVE